MSRYSGSNQTAGTPQAMAAGFKTLVLLTAATATLTRAIIFDVTLGTDGVPADNALVFDVSRTTTSLGTGTTAPSNPIDMSTRAAGSVLTVNHTVEPTVTAASSLLSFGMNQRASYRWVAAPDSGLIVPATNLAGIAIRAKSSSYVGTDTASIFFEE